MALEPSCHFGNQPDIELAGATGLDCDNSIAATASCRSSDPDIYLHNQLTVQSMSEMASVFG